MLKNIALIASVISALTAVTTSLRAVGKARELSYHPPLPPKAACHVNNNSTGKTHRKGDSLIIHFIVTVIWFALSVVFALPLVIQEKGGNEGLHILLCASPFLLLAFLIWIIWRKVMKLKGEAPTSGN